MSLINLCSGANITSDYGIIEICRGDEGIMALGMLLIILTFFGVMSYHSKGSKT